jgi:hypothetical protein
MMASLSLIVVILLAVLILIESRFRVGQPQTVHDEVKAEQ